MSRDHMKAPLVWLDLETTGSDEAKGSILELGCFLSEPSPPFPIISKDFSVVIRDVGWRRLIGDARWARDLKRNAIVDQMHIDNGLIRDVREHGVSLQTAQHMTVEWLESQLDPTMPPFRLAGSGVSHFDSRWLRRHMPALWKFFFYAPLDVGSIRRMLEYAGRSDLLPPPPNTFPHRALPDAHRAYGEFLTSAAQLQRVPVEP